MKKIIFFIIYVFVIGCNEIDKYKSTTVRDSETGLVWQDSSGIVKRDWNGANKYCNELTLDGYSNWRLPHIDELMSISDKSRYNPAIKKIFKNTKTDDCYWSITKYKNDSSQSWVVYFNDGNDNWYFHTNSYFVRCVQ